MIFFPAIPYNRLCFLTADTFKSIDTLMVEDYFVSIPQLMECAGLATAEICRYLCEDVKKPKISIFVGRGHNGGDGLVCAAHLFNWGIDTRVYLSHPLLRYNPLNLQHIQRLEMAGVPIKKAVSAKKLSSDSHILESDLIVDGLLGFGLKGIPKKPYATLIPYINSLKKTVLSIDLPSGINATTGQCDLSVTADLTLSFGAPKKGFLIENVKKRLGRLIIADIGIPTTLYKHLKIEGYPQFNSRKFLEVFL